MKTNAPKAKPKAVTSPDSVDDLLAGLDHPLMPVVQALRVAIRSVSPTIGEEVKWNSPSFYTSSHFATIHLGRRTKARPEDHVMVILHRGARSRPSPHPEPALSDPDDLLERLGKDRYAVTFRSVAEVKARTPRLQAIVRQWIRSL